MGGVLLYGVMILMSILVPFSIPFVAMAFLHTIFISSLVYLGGVGTFILNAMLGVHRNFFSYNQMGRQFIRSPVINSDDLEANAIASGLTSSSVGFVFATMFGSVTFACDLAGLPFASFILPVLGLSMLCVVLLAEIVSRTQMKSWIEPTENQPVDPVKSKIALWFSNWVRNGLTQSSLGIVMSIGFIALIVLRAMKVSTPALFAHFSASIFLQFAFVALPLMLFCVALTHLKEHWEDNWVVDMPYIRVEYPVSSDMVNRTATQPHVREFFQKVIAFEELKADSLSHERTDQESAEISTTVETASDLQPLML